MTLTPRTPIVIAASAATVDVEAAGRALSKRNAKRIQNAWTELTGLLMDAGLIDEESIADMMDSGDGDGDTEAGYKGKGKKKTEMAAGAMVGAEPEATVLAPTSVEAALKENLVAHVQRRTWYLRLSTILQALKRRFEDIHELGEDRLFTNYGSRDRDELAQQLIADIGSLLTELHNSYPGIAPSDEARWEAESPYYMSKQADEAEGEDSQPVNQIKLEFQCAIRAEAEVATHTPNPVPRNRHGISVVLFRVDEPSEAIPAVGAGLPMYVPSDVAAQVVDTVAGLPLDASDDLNHHANDELTGVMMSAEIVDQDFVVHGYLWPKSQPEKVAAILSNKSEVGASMTASAWGHAAEVDGRTVFWVDALDLQGGCLLFAKQATYQQTRLIEANHLVPDREQAGSIPVAASAPEGLTPAQSEPTEDPMDPTELKTAVTEIVKAQVGDVASSVTELAASVSKIATAVNVLLEDREERIQAAQAATAEQQRASEREAIKAEVLKELGGVAPVAPQRREVQPATKSVPLVAQQVEPEGNSEALNLQLELARLDGAITANVAAGRQATAEHMQLLDQRRVAMLKLSALQQRAA